MFTFGKIHFEVQGLTQQIASMFEVDKEGLEKELEESFKKVIEEFDIEAEVRRHAIPALERAVKHSVEFAASRLVHDPELQEILFDRLKVILVQEQRARSGEGYEE